MGFCTVKSLGGAWKTIINQTMGAHPWQEPIPRETRVRSCNVECYDRRKLLRRQVFCGPSKVYKTNLSDEWPKTRGMLTSNVAKSMLDRHNRCITTTYPILALGLPQQRYE